MTQRRIMPWERFAEMAARTRPIRNYDPIRDGEPFVKKVRMQANEPAQSEPGLTSHAPRRGGKFWRLPDSGGVWFKPNRGAQ